MPRYVIERDMPRAGGLSQQDLVAISQKSCKAIEELSSQIQWMESFVTDNKFYCVYLAPDRSFIMEHAYMAGFPANRIEEIKSVINPATAEAVVARG